jgi:hypothetical protein
VADVARVKANMAKKSVSLNEAERRKELQEGKARRAQREQEKRAHRASMPTTYELTVETASAPKLPPPMKFTEPKPAPDAGTDTPPDDLDEETPNRSPADDLLLNETVKILQDYVGQFGHKPTGN